MRGMVLGEHRYAYGKTIWNSFIIALIGLSLFVLYMGVYSATAKNADPINGYLIGLDMGRGNWRLAGWHLPIDNYWFQDALAYAVATRLFGEHPIFMVALPALTAAGVVVTAWAISRSGLESRDAAWPVLVIGAVLALPVLRDNPLMVFLAVGSDHVLTLLQALLILLLVDRFLSRGNIRFLVLALLLGTACVAGDPLATVIVALPAAGAALLTNQVPPGRRAALAGGMVFTIAVGHAIVAVNQATGGFAVARSDAFGLHFAHFADLGHNASLTAEALLSFSSADFFGLPALRALPQLLHLPVVLLIGWVTAVTCRSISGSVSRLRPTALNFLDCALALGVLLLIASCLFSTVMVDFWSGRYLLPAVAYGAILTARRAPQFTFRPLIGGAAIFGSLLGANAYALAFSPNLRVDGNAPELAGWLENHGLRFGYAQYWTAGPITAVSRGKVEALAVIADEGRLAPYLSNSRRDWYPASLDSRRPFFVVVDATDDHAEAFKSSDVQALFGSPSESVDIAGSKIEIYR